MCEYCGCQALDAIAELTREHDAVVALISHVRDAHAARDVARMTELAVRITEVLGPHTVVEEQGLFPALADEFPDHVGTLTDEHRRIEKVLTEASGGVPTDPTWPDRLIETLRLLREHILVEQDGVFPAALASLTPADWETVDRVRGRAGGPSDAD
jgi:hemerythrin-like domain-containing protein